MTLRMRTITVALATAALLFTGCARSAGGTGSEGVASLSDGGDDRASGGDGDGTSGADDEATEEEILDWAQCMRDQGVDIPDPEIDGDGNLILGGPRRGTDAGADDGSSGDDDEDADADGDAGTDDPPELDREEMEAATEECGEPPFRGGGGFSEEERQEMQDAALAFAECMRDEGIDFPDPDFSQDGPGGPGGGPDTGSSGDEDGDDGDAEIRGPFGEIDMDDPDVAAAFEACQDVLGDGAPRGPIVRGTPPPGAGSDDSNSDDSDSADGGSDDGGSDDGGSDDAGATT
jgi:hypothetical protein